ncbi:MAG: HAD family hydrolase [Chloroflexota bacterium]
MATLIFDLDGTLLDCRARHYTVYSDSLEELGQEPISEASYWRRRMNGDGTFDVISRLAPEITRSFRITWMGRIERRDYLAYDDTFVGTLEALAELRKEHRLVLLTFRRDPYALDWQLAKTGLIDLFDEAISPTVTAPQRKSELLADWLPMGDTYVIGDTEADIDLASDLGARYIGVTTGVRSQSYLHSRGGVLTLDSVAELPAFLRLPEPPLSDNRFAAPIPTTAPVARGRF